MKCYNNKEKRGAWYREVENLPFTKQVEIYKVMNMRDNLDVVKEGFYLYKTRVSIVKKIKENEVIE